MREILPRCLLMLTALLWVGLGVNPGVEAVPYERQEDRCTARGMAVYNVTFSTYWSKEDFPKQYPLYRPPAQWTKVIGRTHDADYFLWREGYIASQGLKKFAEFGKTDTLDHETQGHGGILDCFHTANIDEGVGAQSTVIFTDASHPMVSLISRIVPSPDWFVGVDSASLCRGSVWLENHVIDLNILDAGTDQGFTFTAPNWAEEPQKSISKITAQLPNHPANSFYYPNLVHLPTIARVEIHLVKQYGDGQIEKPVAGEESGDGQSPQQQNEVDSSEEQIEPTVDKNSESEYYEKVASTIDQKAEGTRERIENIAQPVPIEKTTTTTTTMPTTTTTTAAATTTTTTTTTTTPEITTLKRFTEEPEEKTTTPNAKLQQKAQPKPEQFRNTGRKSSETMSTPKPEQPDKITDKSEQPQVLMPQQEEDHGPRQQYESLGRNAFQHQKHRGKNQAPSHHRSPVQKHDSQEDTQTVNDRQPLRDDNLMGRKLNPALDRRPQRANTRHGASKNQRRVKHKHRPERRRKHRQHHNKERSRSTLVGAKPVERRPLPNTAPVPSKGPVDCRVSGWGDWTACSKTCGFGNKVRVRTVVTQPRDGGTKCPLLTESQLCGTMRGCGWKHFTFGRWNMS